MSEYLLNFNSCESAGKAADEGNAITEEKVASSATEDEQDRKLKIRSIIKSGLKNMDFAESSFLNHFKWRISYSAENLRKGRRKKNIWTGTIKIIPDNSVESILHFL